MTPDDYNEWRKSPATEEWFALIEEMHASLREALGGGAYTDLENLDRMMARTLYNQGQADALELVLTLEPNLEEENESSPNQKLPADKADRVRAGYGWRHRAGTADH